MTVLEVGNRLLDAEGADDDATDDRQVKVGEHVPGRVGAFASGEPAERVLELPREVEEVLQPHSEMNART